MNDDEREQVLAMMASITQTAASLLPGAQGIMLVIGGETYEGQKVVNFCANVLPIEMEAMALLMIEKLQDLKHIGTQTMN